jgi:hypothetical protein
MVSLSETVGARGELKGKFVGDSKSASNVFDLSTLRLCSFFARTAEISKYFLFQFII